MKVLKLNHCTTGSADCTSTYHSDRLIIFVIDYYIILKIKNRNFKYIIFVFNV